MLMITRIAVRLWCPLPLLALLALPLGIPRESAAQRGVPRTSVAAPETEIFLVPLTVRGDTVRAGTPANVTRRAGYDNQPAFARDGRSVFYTSNRGDGHTDIYRFDLTTGRSSPVRRTIPESEYSAFPTNDGLAVTVIRVEADSTQRLWRLPLDSAEPRVMFPEIKPVGYFAQANDSTWALFVLGTPATLQLAYHGRGQGTVIARDVGRSLHRIPETGLVSFVQKGRQPWHVMQLDPDTRRLDTLVALPARSEDVVWLNRAALLVGNGSELHLWRRDTAVWVRVADFGSVLTNITRMAVSPDGQWLAIVAEAPSTAPGAH